MELDCRIVINLLTYVLVWIVMMELVSVAQTVQILIVFALLVELEAIVL